MTVAAALVLIASTVILTLGCAHLLLTFRGRLLWPRNEAVKRQMEGDCPRISNQTTMWRAWVGFNASHSMGALLFGAVFGYFALAIPETFFASGLLQAAGALFLLGYCLLGWNYWFNLPLRSILIAAALYVIGLVVRHV